MVHVTSFTVFGLNGRKKPIHADLNRRVNVFFGANGSGKTSILRILDSAFSGDASSIDDIKFDKAIVKVHSKQYEREFTLTCDRSQKSSKSSKNDLHNKINTTKQKYSEKVTVHRIHGSRFGEVYISPLGQRNEWDISPVPDAASKRISNWERVYLSTNRLYSIDGKKSSAQSEDQGGYSEKGLESLFSTAIQSVWGQRFGQITKKVNKIQEEGLQKVLAEVLSPPVPVDKKPPEQSVLDAERAYERMSRFLSRQSSGSLKQALGEPLDFIQRYKTELHLRNIVRHIDDVETKIDVENQPIKALSNLISNLFSVGKRVSFDGPTIQVVADDGSPIGIGRLSSGEKHVIKILLSAMEAGISSLILDEPELSMHIDWQTSLLANIHVINPCCQIICATHSPEIMADVLDEEIFRI